MLAPKLEALSNELSSVEFYKINVGEVEVGDISQLAQFKIEVLPTFIICKVNGNTKEFIARCAGKSLHFSEGQ